MCHVQVVSSFRVFITSRPSSSNNNKDFNSKFDTEQERFSIAISISAAGADSLNFYQYKTPVMYTSNMIMGSLLQSLHSKDLVENQIRMLWLSSLIPSKKKIFPVIFGTLLSKKQSVHLFHATLLVTAFCFTSKYFYIPVFASIYITEVSLRNIRH